MPKKKLLELISQRLFALAILTIPISLSTVIWQNDLFLQGSHNTYASVGLYFNELIIFSAFSTGFIDQLIKKKHISQKAFHGIGITLILILISILISSNKLISALSSVHLLSGILMIYMIIRKQLKINTIIKLFIATITIQAIIGIFQFMTQGSIGLGWIGESLISPETSGVAKFNLGSHTLIRAYGTFPHPNIFAGFLMSAILLSETFKANIKPIKTTSIQPILITALIFTASKTALIATLIAFLIIKKVSLKKTIPFIGLIGLALILKHETILQHETVQERLEYLIISSKMLLHSPQGVGLQQFTEHMQSFTQIKLQPWQFQPVHNAFLLIANEMGIWTLALTIGVISKLRNIKNKHILGMIAALITLGLFDHYLFSIYQGIILTGIMIGILIQVKTEPTKSG
jgi:hypothetical protein